MSGCAIWRAIQDGAPPETWESADAKLVAVETGTYLSHTIMEGTRIRHVLRMIAIHWPDLAATPSPPISSLSLMVQSSFARLRSLQ